MLGFSSFSVTCHAKISHNQHHGDAFIRKIVTYLELFFKKYFLSTFVGESLSAESFLNATMNAAGKRSFGMFHHVICNILWELNHISLYPTFWFLPPLPLPPSSPSKKNSTELASILMASCLLSARDLHTVQVLKRVFSVRKNKHYIFANT